MGFPCYRDIFSPYRGIIRSKIPSCSCASLVLSRQTLAFSCSGEHPCRNYQSTWTYSSPWAVPIPRYVRPHECDGCGKMVAGCAHYSVFKVQGLESKGWDVSPNQLKCSRKYAVKIPHMWGSRTLPLHIWGMGPTFDIRCHVTCSTPSPPHTGIWGQRKTALLASC